MEISSQKRETAISIIVPMFNVEHVVDRCLLSLSQQNIENIEVLFVNDCSTDGTAAKIATWIEKQKSDTATYRLISHESNKGVAAARNTGLDNATGKYIYYVDADDYIEPETLRTLYENAETNGWDIAGCEWLLTFKQNERHMVQPDTKNGREMFEKMTQGVMRWNLWLFLVKRELYEREAIRFIPQMNMGEDLMVMLKLTLMADKVGILHKPLYHYIQTNADSLTKSYEKSIPQITANIEEAERYLREKRRTELLDNINMLKLNVKLPFLISARNEDYRIWLEWFPEANKYIDYNKELPWRTRFIQKAARAKQFWILKLYYWLVIKVLYGLIYK